MKSLKPLKQLKLSVPAQETPITSFFTTQTLNGLLPESLYKRISSIDDPSILVVPVLDQWVRKGREIRKQELQDIIRELKNYKRFKHALEQGQTATAKYLIEHGADLASFSELGATALHHSAGIGDIELLKFLLSRGANVDSQSDVGTPLLSAAGHVQ